MIDKISSVNQTDTRFETNDVSPVMVWGIIGSLCLIQTAAFITYSLTYVESVPFLRGDTNWYVFFSYEMYDALFDRNWAHFLKTMRMYPWGVLMWFESVFSQILFGVGRTQILLVNYVHFLACQVATYAFFSCLGRSRALGLMALALFMSMATPFRELQGVHSIMDFHPDLIATCLFIMLYYAIAASDFFATKKGTLGVSLLAVYLTYMRLVSLFTLTATLGMLFVLLSIYTYRTQGEARKSAILRLKHFLLVGVASYLPLVVAHFWFSWRAVGNHYFRFVFDEKFRKETVSFFDYGLNGALDGMHWVMRMVLTEDFGTFFFVALACFALTAIVGRFFKTKETAPKPLGYFSNNNLFYIFLLFLLCTGLVNLYQHGSFPVKSIHLTRLTMAPFFVLITSALVFFTPRIPVPRLHNPRILAGLICVLFIIPLAIQFKFYTSPWRLAETQGDNQIIIELYEDILKYANKHQLKELRISKNYAASPPGLLLGGGLQPAVYIMEKEGRFLPAPPLFGSNILKLYSREEARSLLSKSDIVFLTANPAKHPVWQLDIASNNMFEWLREYVGKTMKLQKNVRVLREDVNVYFRENPIPQWELRASSSMSDFYGPDWLFSEPRIWHCKWTNTPEWVEFTPSRPVKLTSLGIQSQVGAPERAPKEFILQGSLDGKTWENLIDIPDAGITMKKPSRTWELDMEKSYKQYRLYITKTNGDPDLLTIQNLSVEIE